MRRIVVYIAISADGYIARANGSVDWLDRPRPKGNYGMSEFLHSADTILWGRKTYHQTLAWTRAKGPGFGTRIKKYVFSHHPPDAPAPGVEFVNEPVGAFARRLRAEKGKNIWIMVGAGSLPRSRTPPRSTNSAFM